ncbi:MAG TPA: MGMT family protein [Myxococcaceae bacterium]|nr:MGMT family protein [Myxococcaceae bacterium]
MAEPRAPRGAAGVAAAVARVVRSIPPGRVLSYSRVAVLAGLAGRARLVGRLMARAGGSLPWWRVVRADRTLAEPVAAEQARRLRREGVRVQGRRVPRAALVRVGELRPKLPAAKGSEPWDGPSGRSSSPTASPAGRGSASRTSTRRTPGG